MTDAEPRPLSFGVEVPLHQVERELAAQLRGITREEESAPATRVRMSNVVVYTDSLARAQEIALRVPEVVAVHPARVQLLVADSTSTATDIRASVAVTCRSMGQNQEACTELLV